MNRDVHIATYVTEDEADEIRDKADRLNLSVAEYVRSSIFGTLEDDPDDPIGAPPPGWCAVER